MISLEASLDTPQDQQSVFAYLSNFVNTAEWDPGTISVAARDSGPVKVGSKFDVVARFRGRTSTLVYTVERYEPDELISLRGKNRTVESVDTIQVQANGPDTARVTYRAELTLRGVARLAEPFLRDSFDQLGEEAIEGMRSVLGGVRVHHDLT